MTIQKLFFFFCLFRWFGIEQEAFAQRKDTFDLPPSPSEKWSLRMLSNLLDESPNSFWVNGQFNPYLIYRKLDKGYPFVYGGNENLNFAPYPNILSPVLNTIQPTLTFNLGGRRESGISFGVNYAYFFNLEPNKEIRHNFLSQNTLVGSFEINKKWGNLKIHTGAGTMPIYFSRLTLSNRYFREPLFDRTPWEYFSSSDARHENHFQQSILSKSIYNQTAAQGIYLEANQLPGNLEGKLFFGRTQLQLFPNAVFNQTPSELLAGRMAKNWNQGHFLGINAYYLDGWADTRKIFHDQRSLLTLNGQFSGQNLDWSAELGGARLQNPKAGTSHDAGLVLKTALKNRPFAFVIQAFAMGRNFVCMENEVLNANPMYHQGGFSADTTYDNFLFPAYLNPVGFLANNRLGLDLKMEQRWKWFYIGFGLQASQEMEKSGAQISFPHLVNAYSRSRFQPWQQYSGPFGRIGNRFRMSIERILVTQNRNEIKWMNNQFLDMKWKIPFQKRQLMLCSFTQFGAIGLSPFETHSNLEKGFLQSFYQEIELMLPVLKRWTLVGYAGLEQNKASRKTALDTETGNPLNQSGTGYGIGIDYDFAQNFGIYLRHRWMEHKDKSFLLDQFSGQETVAEIKISF
jgi:hypothetical protein